MPTVLRNVLFPAMLARDDIEVAVLEHGIVGHRLQAQEGMAQSLAFKDHRRRVDEGGHVVAGSFCR